MLPPWLFSIPSAAVTTLMALGALWRWGPRTLRRWIRWLVLVNGAAVQDAERAASTATQAATQATEESRRAQNAAREWRETARALEARVRVLEEQLGEITRRENFAQRHIRWLVNRVRQLEETLRASGATPPPPDEPEPF